MPRPSQTHDDGGETTEDDIKVTFIGAMVVLGCQILPIKV